MEVNILVIVWIIGAGLGLYYSVRGARDAWGDLMAVAGDEIARDLAGTAFKTQLMRALIQLIWLIIGVVAVLSIAGVLIVWGLIATNYVLAYLSREAYRSKKRTLEKIMERQKK